MSGFLFMFTWWQYAYAYPVYIPKMSSFPGNRPNEPILWLKDVLDSRILYESLGQGVLQRIQRKVLGET